MIKQIFGTLGAKITVTIFAFFIVILNTRLLGAEGQGTIALINLAIAISLSLNNFIGGGAVVYLIPRVPLNQLALPSYIWSFIVALLTFITLSIWEIFPAEYSIHLAIISFLHSVFLFNAHVLLAKLRISTYNILLVFQVGSLLIALSIFYFILDKSDIESYLFALYLSFGLSFIFSLMSASRHYEGKSNLNITQGAKALWKYGKHAQFANLIHLLNKRMGYIFLDTLFPAGRSGVGIFSVGTQLSESVWIAASSLATVQYSHISNSTNTKLNKQLTLILFKISFLLALAGTLILVSFPEELYQWVFGAEIIGIRPIIIALSPGIVAISCDAILAHHFSGTGRQYLGTRATLIALGVLLIANAILIPRYGITGAAIATSIAFIFQTVYHLIQFFKQDDVRPNELLITRNDLNQAKQIYKKLLQPKSD